MICVAQPPSAADIPSIKDALYSSAGASPAFTLTANNASRITVEAPGY
jgi:hypothetical protein